MKIIMATPVLEEHKKMFEGFDITYIDRANLNEEEIMDAEVVLGNLPVSVLKKMKNLKWVQLDSAGVGEYSTLDESVLLTNASGAYGEAISEHMIGCVLAVMKNLYRYHTLQEGKGWTNLGSVNTIGTSKVLCVGTGNIGSEFGKRMYALGAEVYGVSRRVHETPDYMKKMVSVDDMDTILPDMDIIAISLPGTEKTYHLFDEEMLRKTKKGAILVNVGRGSVIDSEALLKMQEESHFSGVCFDVTEIEPLPVDSRLWTANNVYITPHISGKFNAAVTYGKVMNIFLTNLKHYLNNESLEHIVNKKEGY